MGYTHYYYRIAVLDARRFAAWSKDVQKLLDNLPPTAPNGYDDGPETLEIAGGHGTGKPTVNQDTVNFNGKGEYGHETFSISRTKEPETWDSKPDGGLIFDCCKTARKPYDILVIAALVRIKHHFPNGEVRVSSDGDSKDWQPGVDLCARVFGEDTKPTVDEFMGRG